MKKHLLILLCCLLLPLAVLAQSDSEQNRKQKNSDKKPPIIAVVKADSLSQDLYKEFKNSLGKKFHDSSIPRFVIKDRKDSFIFGIGGYVSIFAYYDDAGRKTPSFAASSISTDGKRPESIYNMDLTYTRIFFKLIGKTKHGIVDAYIETDFHGGDYHLRLRQAYVSFCGVKLGYAWSKFGDPETLPTLDPQGPVSLTNRRVPQISYTHSFKNHLTFAVSLEHPQTISASVQKDSTCNIVPVSQTFPDLPVSLTWDIDRLHLFGGINMRYLKYRHAPKDQKPELAFSCIVSGNWSFYKNHDFDHKFYFNGVYAYGMPDCIQDMEGVGVNVLVPENGERMRLSHSFGFLAGYAFNWHSHSSINLVYSYSENVNDVYSWKGLYKNGQYLALNYIRKVFKYGKVGVEAIGGYREDVDGHYGYNYKISCLFRYDF